MPFQFSSEQGPYARYRDDVPTFHPTAPRSPCNSCTRLIRETEPHVGYYEGTRPIIRCGACLARVGPLDIPPGATHWEVTEPIDLPYRYAQRYQEALEQAFLREVGRVPTAAQFFRAAAILAAYETGVLVHKGMRSPDIKASLAVAVQDSDDVDLAIRCHREVEAAKPRLAARAESDT